MRRVVAAARASGRFARNRLVATRRARPFSPAPRLDMPRLDMAGRAVMSCRPFLSLASGKVSS
jgi:hypothetical protein